MTTKFSLALIATLIALPSVFGPPSPVPDSGSTISLISIGLLGLALVANKRLRK